MSNIGNTNKKECPPCQNAMPDTKKLQKDRCDAAEAILEIKDMGNGKLLLKMADGWEHVLPKDGDNDPGFLIMWDDDNLVATVSNFNTAVADGQVAPTWMGTHPITPQELKMALLSHIHTTAGGGGVVVGDCLIAPNDLVQFLNVAMAIASLGWDSFVVRHAVCPIGRLYVMEDQMAPAIATRARTVLLFA